jgi:hypothetical protein
MLDTAPVVVPKSLIYEVVKGKPYEVTAGGLGLNLSQEDKRGADLAIFNVDGFFLSDILNRKPFSVQYKTVRLCSFTVQNCQKYDSKITNHPFIQP